MRQQARGPYGSVIYGDIVTVMTLYNSVNCLPIIAITDSIKLTSRIYAVSVLRAPTDTFRRGSFMEGGSN
jgi:hypothetical protein